MQNKRNRQSGFTLMEVLFAVAILAIGLIFLACQFPVGMFAARDVVDETRAVIETHNSQVMMEVELSTTKMLLPIREDGSGNTIDWRVYLPLDNRPNGYNHPYDDINKVHMLVKPNVLVTPNLLTNPPSQLILDGVAKKIYGVIPNEPWDSDYGEISGTFAFGNYAYYLDFIANLGNPAQIAEPRWPFWSHDSDTNTNYGISDIYQVTSGWYLGDIGHMMSPPVDESDPEVKELIRQWNPAYDPLDSQDRLDYLHPAILEVSLKRRFCWAAIYKEGYQKYRRSYTIVAPPSTTVDIDVDEDYQSEGEEFYIFTLRKPQKEVRYAVQSSASYPIDQTDVGACYGRVDDQFNSKYGFTYTDEDNSGWPGPTIPGNSSLDRRFPVPWRVCLGDYSVRFRIDIPETTPPNIRPVLYPGTNWLEDHCREFVVPVEIADILLPGSILIDADPHDFDNDSIGKQTTRRSGQMYEVEEVYLGDDGQLWVRLRRPLLDDLHYFWVFPPPIVRYPDGSYDFEDLQPVVKVTQRAADIPRLRR